jgi:hypothetical protein
MKDLFKEAIADAKAVREAALQQAKLALEEALSPKIQSMIAAKLQEMDGDDELDEAKKGEEEIDENLDITEGDDELEEDFDLSEILAELEDEAIEEGKDKEEIEEGKDEEIDEAKKDDEEGEDEGEEEEAEEAEAEEAEKITDLSVDELKDIIKDIISAELAGGDMDGEMDMEMGDEEAAVDVDGGIDGEEMSMDMGGEEEIAGEEEIEEIDLEELLAELDALDEADDKELDEAKKKKADKEKKEDKDDMKEALETIETLRKELVETNLLNAKLLYLNKIFQAKNLTESQKVKVIASFDKATTPKQAKELYESIQKTIGTKKSSIKESLGFASKAAGVAPKSQIVESNDVITRMQKLANIIK